MIRRWTIRRSTAGVLFSLMLAVPATAGPATPPSAFFLFGNESAAYADGPGSLLFNPAAGVRYRNEFALTLLDQPRSKDALRGALTMNSFTLAASGERDAAITPSVAFAGGNDRLRIGSVTTWIPVEGGKRVRDYRIGALSRPAPWLSLGAVADHVRQPRVAGMRLEHEYTTGVSLRPLALSRTKAHTLGTRFTLTADAVFRHGDSDPHYRFGGEVEVVPGLALRGIYFDEDRSFQLGASLLGVRSGYHAQSVHDRDGRPVFATHTVSFHEEEDRTVLAGPAGRRAAVVQIGGDLADEPLSGFSLFGAVSTTAAGPIHRQLERALEDPVTRGVLLDLRGSSGNAQLEELRPRIERLRKAGKPVVAFLEYGSQRGDLYLASACSPCSTAACGRRASCRRPGWWTRSATARTRSASSAGSRVSARIPARSGSPTGPRRAANGPCPRASRWSTRAAGSRAATAGAISSSAPPRARRPSRGRSSARSARAA
jgi:hypothetical protein